MKELSIEEKAQRYDEALERAKNTIEVNQTIPDIVECVESLFPELKESEDERIRKELIEFVKSRGGFKQEYIAWLEKQGNLMKALQISNANIGELIEKNYYLREQLEKQGENNMGISEATKKKLEDNLNKALEKETPESWNKFLEEQGEQKHIFEMKTPEESLGIDSETYNKIVDECVYGVQKPADEIKPKFKHGDWLQYRNAKPFLVKEITRQGYVNGEDCLPFCWENEIHLWTIEDAKDGDVLVSESTCGLGTWYCIFKSLDGDESMTVYCYLARDGRFETKKELCFDKDPYNTKPATKEQRDKLEKVMANAGYEWDAEHRQLRKIEPKQEELTEFEKAVKQVMEEAIECGDTHNLKADADMLLRLVQKSSWSEEDEENLNWFEKFFRPESLITKCKDIPQDRYLWFKSLKDRVQPQPKQEWSEEDNRMCKAIIDNIQAICEEGYFVGNIDSDELIKWLKSLKERYAWRPSYEQIKVLEFVMEDIEKDSIRYGILNSVLEQLKKLKG